MIFFESLLTQTINYIIPLFFNIVYFWLIYSKWHVLGPVVDFTWLKIRPTNETLRLRRVQVVLPLVERETTSSRRRELLVSMRSLRWLDRANLLTLLGKKFL